MKLRYLALGCLVLLLNSSQQFVGADGAPSKLPAVDADAKQQPPNPKPDQPQPPKTPAVVLAGLKGAVASLWVTVHFMNVKLSKASTELAALQKVNTALSTRIAALQTNPEPEGESSHALLIFLIFLLLAGGAGFGYYYYLQTSSENLVNLQAPRGQEMA
eukprot:807639_1